MNPVLAILALFLLLAAVLVRLEVNHRRVTAWPAARDAPERDSVRLRADLAGVSGRSAPAPVRPRQVRRQPAPLQSSLASRS